MLQRQKRGAASRGAAGDVVSRLRELTVPARHEHQPQRRGDLRRGRERQVTLAFGATTTSVAPSLLAIGVSRRPGLGGQDRAAPPLQHVTNRRDGNCERRLKSAARGGRKVQRWVGFGIYSGWPVAPRKGLSGRRGRAALPSAGVPEAIALALRLEDVAAVREPVEGGPREVHL